MGAKCSKKPRAAGPGRTRRDSPAKRQNKRIWGTQTPRAFWRGQRVNTLSSGSQQQPKLHGTRQLSPLQAQLRNIDQVHPSNSRRGPYRPRGETRTWEKKNGIDWTSIHEAN